MTESEEPSLLRLNTEKAEPKLVKARTESVEARFKKSSTDTALPSRAKLRIASEDPK